jgi:micrococcal nuclease
MAAPVKPQEEQTGNFKGLAIGVGALLVLFGALLWASFLSPSPAPSNSIPQQQTEQAPQVQGQTTEEEFVPEEDIRNTEEETSDVSTLRYTVTSVSDGDTIKVLIDGKTETVRLIGVDTPETKDPRKAVQCYGAEASAYTKTMLLSKSVSLAQDDSQQNRDKYGRLLRYVFLEDGTNFNEQLIRAGYAYEYTYRTPYQYQAVFKQAEQAARANSVGLWNSTTCSGNR